MGILQNIGSAVDAFVRIVIDGPGGVLGPTDPIRQSTLPDFRDVYLVDVTIAMEQSSKIAIGLGGRAFDGHVTIGHGRINGPVTEASLQDTIAELLQEDPRSRTKYISHEYRGEHQVSPTRMSFHGTRDCIIVYRLTNKNAFFTRETYAIQKERGVPDTVLPWMRRIADDGEVLRYDKGFVSGDPARNDRTKMAALAYSKQPTGSLARFNLYLDIIEDLDDQESSYIPIIVDPDIRYPGGHGEP